MGVRRARGPGGRAGVGTDILSGEEWSPIYCYALDQAGEYTHMQGRERKQRGSFHTEKKRDRKKRKKARKG